MFYRLTPEVAGHLGPSTIFDRSQHPPVVRAVHYEFDGWPDDDLITAFPCFLVTNKMKAFIEETKATGCAFGPVKVTTSEQFEELEELENLKEPRELPSYWWLIVNGTAERDDFGVSEEGMLVVSEKLLQVLRKGNLNYCDTTKA